MDIKHFRTVYFILGIFAFWLSVEIEYFILMPIWTCLFVALLLIYVKFFKTKNNKVVVYELIGIFLTLLLYALFRGFYFRKYDYIPSLFTFWGIYLVVLVEFTLTFHAVFKIIKEISCMINGDTREYMIADTIFSILFVVVLVVSINLGIIFSDPYHVGIATMFVYNFIGFIPLLLSYIVFRLNYPRVKMHK